MEAALIVRRSRAARHAVVAAIAFAAAAACNTSSNTASAAITLFTPPDGGAAYIEVTGAPDSMRRASPEDLARALRVSVAADAPPILGTYGVAGRSVRFTPLYPFDPGRQYRVVFTHDALPAPLDATVGLPAPHTTPSTVVARVYPSGDVVPENLLRMYIEFSGPMGRPSGIAHMKLVDEDGREIEGAFLPLDYEFWSPDHTRFTAFLDPGRVKRGILPNQKMGRALTPGHAVTLAISREWRDQHGLPLKADFTRVRRVGPADTQPIDPAAWRIEPPPPGGRGGLVVRFPEALDRGLLMRALGVRREHAAVDGEVVIGGGETQWTFTPQAPWRAGAYQLIALDILEDVAGNQIGRAFEVDNFDTVDKSPNPKSIVIPFTIPAAPAAPTR
jgi:hypothetical protein